MARQETEYDLLFGVLALQLDLIDEPGFVEACTAWAARKEVPLADLLVDRGRITPDDRADVDRLLRRKLERHGGDARRSLADLADGRVARALTAVDDFEVRDVVTSVASG